MESKTPQVAIVGRPNVGKSTLFNRLVGERRAIVGDEPGITRDRIYGQVEWSGKQFSLIDTGGIVPDDDAVIPANILKQAGMAIDESQLLVWVVDARAGITQLDEELAALLRSTGKPVLIAANKTDSSKQESESTEFYRFGFDDVFPISAEQGIGVGDLLDRIIETLEHKPVDTAEQEERGELRLAIVGRPNVGKSSFVNRLLGEERLVVSEIAGTTRDAIDTPMRYHERTIVFIDTAGLRRQSKVEDGIEFYSALRTRRAIERAEICLLVIDATEGLHNQDLKIANLAWEAGRGLIVIVNKWDLKEKDDKTAARFEKECADRAPFLGFVPFIFTSALTGQRVTRTLDVLLEVEAERSKRINTSQVNNTLEALVARRQPPQAAGREVRLLYATQVEVAPPTIAVFGNHPELVAEHYVRYLHNGFREAWGFTGNPLRVVLRRRAA